MSHLHVRNCCAPNNKNNINRLRTSSPQRRQRAPEGICEDRLNNVGGRGYNHNLDKNLLSLLLFFHSGSSSSMVAIDNKIEQAMDLVKSHLMYAVREEVEVLKEQIKELIDRNSLLERENTLLKSLVSSEQLTQIQGPSRTPGGSGGSSSAANPSTA